MDSPYSGIIYMYAKDIHIISEILSTKLRTTKEKYIYKIDSELESIKLSDVFLKYKGSSLAQYLEKDLDFINDDSLKSKWGFPEISTSFNNKQATIDIFYKQREGEDVIGSIGVQIEGKDFKLHAGPRKIKGENNKDNRDKNIQAFFNDMKNYEYFEDFSKKKTIRGRITSMKKEYCRYVNKNTGGFHIYQYFNLKNEEDYEFISKLVKDELERVVDIIDNKNFIYK